MDRVALEADGLLGCGRRPRLIFDDTGIARDGLLRLVEEAIQLASREVYGVATSQHGKAGMGTTLKWFSVAQ
jgi:hypothetical protein